MTDDRIDWGRINKEDFERFVDALLVRLYQSDPERIATAVDGRGGDGGVDIDVRQGDDTVQVFQLKYFPEGFSGGWAKTRRAQIKKSFLEAAKIDTLKDWTLVIPRNATPAERRWLGALREQRDLRLHVYGRAELDGMLSKHPDLLGWAVRESVVDTFKQMRQETAALVGPDDLANRVRSLQALADTRSPYWGVTMSTDAHGVVSQAFYAKRPDAQEREPIHFRFNAVFTPDHDALRLDFERSRDYGLTAPITLPPEVIQAFRIVGPDWIAREAESAEVELHPRRIPKRIPCEARILTPGGATLASLQGIVTGVDQGILGMTFEATFRGIFTMQFIVPKEGDTGTANLSYDVAEAPVSDAAALFRFLRVLEGGDQFQFLVEGKQAFKLDTTKRSEGAEESAVEDGIFQVVEDLDALERDLGVSFNVPADITERLQITIRATRMLLEGKCIVMPFAESMTGNIGARIADEALREAMLGVHAHRARIPNWEATVLDQRLVLGTLVTYHPAVVIKDAQEVLDALDRGEESAIVVSPSDDTGFRIWIGERRPAGSRAIPEPIVLRGMTQQQPHFPSLSDLQDGIDPYADSLTQEA
jgi:hypothetical protein